MNKIIVVLFLTLGLAVTFLGLGNVGMWDQSTVYLVKSPDGQTVASYLKAAGHTGHKKFIDAEEVDKYDKTVIIEYKTEKSTQDIIDQAGNKSWIGN